MIPKQYLINHKSRAFLQPAAAACTERMRRILPDFREIWLSDSEADRWVLESAPEYQEFWRFLNRGVHRSDFFRYLYVYKEGGFYFDTDVWIAEHFESLCQYDLVLPFEEVVSEDEYERRFGMPPEDEAALEMKGNYAFGAAPRHPFFARLIEEVIVNASGWPLQSYGDKFILDSTGPHILNNVWRHYSASAGANELEKIAILAGRSEDPFAWGGSHPHYRFGAYGNHLMLGRWRG